MALEEVHKEIDILKHKIQQIAKKIDLLKKENMILLQDNVSLKKELERNKSSSFVDEKFEEKNTKEENVENWDRDEVRKEIDQSIAALDSCIDWLKEL